MFYGRYRDYEQGYNTANGMTDELNKLEPEKCGYDYTKNEALNALRLAWLGDRDSNPGYQGQNLASYH